MQKPAFFINLELSVGTTCHLLFVHHSRFYFSFLFPYFEDEQLLSEQGKEMVVSPTRGLSFFLDLDQKSLGCIFCLRSLVKYSKKNFFPSMTKIVPS